MLSILLGWCFGFTAAQVYKLEVGKLCGGFEIEEMLQLEKLRKVHQNGKRKHPMNLMF